MPQNKVVDRFIALAGKCVDLNKELISEEIKKNGKEIASIIDFDQFLMLTKKNKDAALLLLNQHRKQISSLITSPSMFTKIADIDYENSPCDYVWNGSSVEPKVDYMIAHEQEFISYHLLNANKDRMIDLFRELDHINHRSLIYLVSTCPNDFVPLVESVDEIKKLRESGDKGQRLFKELIAQDPAYIGGLFKNLNDFMKLIKFNFIELSHTHYTKKLFDSCMVEHISQYLVPLFKTANDFIELARVRPDIAGKLIYLQGQKIKELFGNSVELHARLKEVSAKVSKGLEQDNSIHDVKPEPRMYSYPK